jgi:hypothetical protein
MEAVIAQDGVTQQKAQEPFAAMNVQGQDCRIALATS